MKLLLDANLSHRLLPSLQGPFPGSSHVRLVGLAYASDADIWRYAYDNGFTIVTMDADFYDISVLRGPPPQVVWLKTGNTSTAFVRELLEKRREVLREFAANPEDGCLVLDVMEA